MSKTVEQLMTRVVFVVAPHHTVAVAEATMRQGGVRHLAVVTTEGAVVAMLAERDLALANSEASVADVMSPDPVSIRVNAPAYEAIALMLQHRVHALPVLDDDGGLAGIVTSTDVMIEAYEALARDAEQRDRRQPMEVEQALLRAQLQQLHDAHHPAAMATAIAQLKRFVVQHFAREEQIGGIYQQIEEEQPDLHAEIQALRDEHRTIVNAAQLLLEQNRELAERDQHDVAPGVTALTTQIEQHEAHEAIVVERALAAL